MRYFIVSTNNDKVGNRRGKYPDGVVPDPNAADWGTEKRPPPISRWGSSLPAPSGARARFLWRRRTPSCRPSRLAMARRNRKTDPSADMRDTNACLAGARAASAYRQTGSLGQATVYSRIRPLGVCGHKRYGALRPHTFVNAVGGRKPAKPPGTQTGTGPYPTPALRPARTEDLFNLRFLAFRGRQSYGP